MGERKYNLNGRPPEGHKRQCHAHPKNHGGRRCRKWALTGSDYCQWHGGWRRKYDPIERLPVFYSGRLRGKLKQVIENTVSTPAEEQLSLLEELALMREFTARTLLAYEKADDLPEGPKRTVALEAATIAAISGLESVRELCQAAARIDTLMSGHVSQHSLRVIVGQMVRIMYDICGEEYLHIAQEFEQRIDRDVKLPTRDSQGTTLTPDQDVLEMDSATAPKEAES